jgi:hypothetical protein
MATTYSKLVEIATTARDKHTIANVYHNQTGFIYDTNHPNATQAKGGTDDPNNYKGKGTNIKFDTTNGGSVIDIKGSPAVMGSGRNAIYTENLYNPDKVYDLVAT